eukprot:5180538-Prymnesium_polylepis.2
MPKNSLFVCLLVAPRAFALQLPFNLPTLPTGGPTAASVLTELFGDCTVDPGSVAAACSPDVIWEDMCESSPFVGPEAVLVGLAKKWPEGSELRIERISDGTSSGGFTWHREARGKDGSVGLRGTLYAEIDTAGKLTYVREGCEPIFKAGVATEALLKAATQAAGPRPPGPPA